MIENTNSVYYIPIHLAWQNIKKLNTVYIMDLKNSKFYYFDGVSSQIWNSIIEKKSKQDIIKTLTKEYAIDEEIINSDVTEFMNDLIGKELLKVDKNGF